MIWTTGWPNVALCAWIPTRPTMCSWSPCWGHLGPCVSPQHLCQLPSALGQGIGGASGRVCILHGAPLQTEPCRRSIFPTRRPSGKGLHLPSACSSCLAWRHKARGAVLFTQSIICSDCSRDKVPLLRMPGSETPPALGPWALANCTWAGGRTDLSSTWNPCSFQRLPTPKACSIPGTCQLGFLEPACTGNFFKNIAAPHLVGS